MWKQKLIKRENARALSELATELKVPNNEVRDSQKVLFQFMDELRLVLARAFILKEKCIKIGDTVLDGGARLKVMKIRKDFLIQLEGRAGGVSPQNVTIAQP